MATARVIATARAAGDGLALLLLLLFTVCCCAESVAFGCAFASEGACAPLERVAPRSCFVLMCTLAGAFACAFACVCAFICADRPIFADWAARASSFVFASARACSGCRATSATDGALCDCATAAFGAPLKFAASTCGCGWQW